MNTEPRKCPLNEQAVGWALHALEPDEEIAVLLHMPQCASCQRAAGEAERVLATLGVAVPQAVPPPALRDSLMARVAQTPQRTPLVHTGARPVVRTAAPRVGSQNGSRHRAEERRDTRPKDSRPGRGGRGRTWGRRLVAASLALVAVLAIGGLGLRNAQLERERDAEAAQTQAVSNLVDQLDRPGVQHALLARDDGSTVAAVLVENGSRRIFTIGLPNNAADRDTYVLWGIAEGSNPKALGTFDVSAADEGQQAVGATGTRESFIVYAVSLEPGRAAPASPSAVVAKGPVVA